MKRETENARPERKLRTGWFFLPEIERVEIPAPDWLRGRRLLFAADIHLRRQVSDEVLSALIGRFASVRADMLLLGGDYAESGADCRRLFRALAELNFPLGAFAVLGNNDRASRDRLRDWTAEANVALLVNERRSVSLPGGRLHIGGSDEHKYGKPRTANLFPADGYRVLLSHFPAPPECECELMLSGHTHAGQIRLLGLTPYSIGYERRYRLLATDGLHRIGDMNLLVSPGIGVSKLPLRLNAEPMAHLIEFTGGER